MKIRHESHPYRTSAFETARPELYDRRVSSSLPQISTFHRASLPPAPLSLLSLPISEHANDAMREKQFPFKQDVQNL